MAHDGEGALVLPPATMSNRSGAHEPPPIHRTRVEDLQCWEGEEDLQCWEGEESRQSAPRDDGLDGCGGCPAERRSWRTNPVMTVARLSRYSI